MSKSRESLMRRAIELSLNGFPAPNPRVGCVIVNNEEIVGEGWHDHAGGDHAEVAALKIAGVAARGAEVYCTLEPCNHHGRTPPCSQALIAAGVSRVNYAVDDPNPLAVGGGRALLDAGIEIQTGLLREAAEAANALFLTAVRRKRPVVVCKSAQTADGFIARQDGTSKWITCEESRKMGHRLRAELGCVLVGRATVECDDPELTARVEGVVNQPLRVVLDPNAKTPKTAKLFAQEAGVIRFVAPGHASEAFDKEIKCEGRGFDIGAMLDYLHDKGAIGVLVEGGGETIASFLRAGFVDRIEVFVSPTTLGHGRYWLGEIPPQKKLQIVHEEPVGTDIWRTLVPSA